MFLLVSCVAPSSLFPLEKHLPIAINTCSSPPNAGSFGCSDALRYHSPPKALFGGKLDRSALVESVVLLACRGGLQDQEVSVRATAGRAREEAHTIPESSLLLGSLFLLLVFFLFFKTRGTGASLACKLLSIPVLEEHTPVRCYCSSEEDIWRPRSFQSQMTPAILRLWRLS